MRGSLHRRLLRNWQRTGVWVAIWVGACWLWWGGAPLPAHAARDNWTVPPAPPILLNPNFECAGGVVPGVNGIGEEVLAPHGWTLVPLEGAPMVYSTRLRYAKQCDQPTDKFIERLEGEDSWIILSQDVDSPPRPGKVFDVALYQQVRATYGGDYSLSAWMISLCGNKSKPFDCPPENYIVKAIGIDPYGGTDPESPNIIWEKNYANFVDAQGKRVGWQNLRMGAKALTGTITIFVRMISPFEFHGNMGFVDAVSLVRAPLARLEAAMSQEPGQLAVRVAWFGQESADIAAIQGGTHVMLYDVQVRPVGRGDWRDLAVGATAEGEVQFVPACHDLTYEFRVRARAEQPDGTGGVWPNQRYPGVWSQPVGVYVPGSVPATLEPAQPVGPEFLYLPAIVRAVEC